MFNKLKDKLKGALSAFSKKASKEGKEEEKPPEKAAETLEEPKKVVEEPQPAEKPQKQEKTLEPETIREEKKEAAVPKKQPEEEIEESLTSHKAEESKPQRKPKEEVEKPKPTEEKKKAKEEPESKDKKEAPKEEEPQAKKGFFTKLSEKFTTVQLTEEKFEELFWELEVTLLENNVALDVIEKIKADLKEELTTGRTARGTVEERIHRRLEETVHELLDIPGIDLLAEADKKTPYVIALIGVNGAGKTTTLAKLAHYMQQNGKKVVIAASDTFRAAAIQQLEEHAKKLGVPIIKQDYGSDPAAVAYDAIKHATAKGIDVVLIDTAGRMHSNANLMDELKKVVRIAKPDRTLFIGEATTGNDCVEQAQEFGKALDIDGIILSKADVDEKGGASLSISYVTKKPILYIGTGQDYDDLEVFDPSIVTKKLLAN